MSEIKEYINKLFQGNKIVIGENLKKEFEEFSVLEENVNAVNKIKELQKILMNNWQLKTRILEIQNQGFSIPNATVGKTYEEKIDFVKLGWSDIIFSAINGLESFGLKYDPESEVILGTPTQSGDHKIKLLFRLKGENEEVPVHEKSVSFIINPDPKSLWKEIASDEGRDSQWKDNNYWKPDNVNEFQQLGTKHIVVASKRGRSHANVGSFRDDDFAFKHLPNNGWSIVAVSDGAGSANVSRKGSLIACESVISFFESNFTESQSQEFDQLIDCYYNEIIEKKEEEPVANSLVKTEQEPTVQNIESHVEISEVAEPTLLKESNGTKVSKFIYNTLGNAARTVHKNLEQFALQKEISLKDLHSTLIFALYKKYDFGYVILSFGVGDCPIGVLNKDMTELKLMNWLDVGEFGGGTRFITMPEIFTSDKFPSRFGFKIMSDFSYLMLMTDGIYDPKFVVEANLEKMEKWKEFIGDLEGNNEDKIKVELKADNNQIADQLFQWMDFWSPGNHDDRTLAIVF